MESNNKRLPGVLYLCMILTGICAQIIRSNILVFEDGVNVLENIHSSLFILRIAFICDLLMAAFFLLTAWALFNRLKRVNMNLSLLFLLLTVASVSVISMNMINHIAIIEVNSAGYLGMNGADDTVLASRFFSNLHGYGYLISQFYFGLWLAPLGIVLLKSKLAPRYFGVMLIAAAFGHLFEMFVSFLFPGNEILTYPGLIVGMVGEFSFCFWLLFKGIK